MMRCRARTAIAIGVLVLAGLTATACGQQRHTCPTGPVPAGLAIAVGDRANSPRPSWLAKLDPQLMRIITRTEQQAAHHQPISVGATFVRVDGDPAISCVVTDGIAGNGTAQNTDNEDFIAAVHQDVAALRATRAQADPLTALSRASAAAGPGGTVVLIDSGLQTVAPLDFAREDLLDADIDSVVSQLRSESELPRLSGQTVILDGIGYTAPPQAPLDQDQRDHLVELWQQIVRAAGAARVETLRAPNTDPAVSRLPPVSTVPVPPPNDVSLGCNQQTILSDDGAVGFLPNSTKFRVPAAARAVLARIADWLRRNPTATASLTGSIAHYGTDDGNGLSRARAERIRSVLIGLGVDAGRISATGVGWGPFPTPTSPPDPVSDPLNRRVVVQLNCR